MNLNKCCNLRKHMHQLFLVLVILIPSVVIAEDEPATQSVPVLTVMFHEQEPGIETYASRMLLSKGFLRMDSGQDQDSFLLFDRKTLVIHSLNYNDGSHMLMQALEARLPESKLSSRTEKQVLSDAPAISGVKPVKHQYFVDEQLCKTSINVKGFLTELVEVLAEFEQAVVQQNLQTLDNIPQEILSGCYMANNYHQAARYLDEGFPLFVQDYLGRSRQMVSFEHTEKPASLFSIPEGYRLFYPNAANLPKN